MAISDRLMSTLLPLLATDLPGCAAADKLNALDRTLGEFCRRSRCWRETLQIAMADGAREADLNWPHDGYAVSVAITAVNGAPRLSRDYRYAIHPPRCNDGRQRIEFAFPPVTGRRWTLEVIGVLVPSRTCTDAPDWIVERYGHAIADGATAILKKHRSKPYSDVAGAVDLQRTFERGISDACCDATRGRRGRAA